MVESHITILTISELDNQFQIGTKDPHFRIVHQTTESRSKEYLHTGAVYEHRELAEQTEHKAVEEMFAAEGGRN